MLDQADLLEGKYKAHPSRCRTLAELPDYSFAVKCLLDVSALPRAARYDFTLREDHRACRAYESELGILYYPSITARMFERTLAANELDIEGLFALSSRAQTIRWRAARA